MKSLSELYHQAKIFTQGIFWFTNPTAESAQQESTSHALELFTGNNRDVNPENSYVLPIRDLKSTALKLYVPGAVPVVVEAVDDPIHRYSDNFESTALTPYEPGSILEVHSTNPISTEVRVEPQLPYTRESIPQTFSEQAYDSVISGATQGLLRGLKETVAYHIEQNGADPKIASLVSNVYFYANLLLIRTAVHYAENSEGVDCLTALGKASYQGAIETGTIFSIDCAAQSFKVLADKLREMNQPTVATELERAANIASGFSLAYLGWSKGIFKAGLSIGAGMFTKGMVSTVGKSAVDALLPQQDNSPNNPAP